MSRNTLPPTREDPPSIFVEANFSRDMFTYAELLRKIDALANSKSRPWTRTPPAKPGWYNASISGAAASFRYWDGKVWSSDIAISRWGQIESWEQAKSAKERPADSKNVSWRSIKPYRDGEEWDFLRE